MKEITLALIKNILAADETVTKEKADDILFVCTQEQPPNSKRRHLIDVKEAMRILDVSRPTLKTYIKRGAIAQIVLSPRKIRFDEENIRFFAENGLR